MCTTASTVPPLEVTVVQMLGNIFDHVHIIPFQGSKRHHSLSPKSQDNASRETFRSEIFRYWCLVGELAPPFNVDLCRSMFINDDQCWSIFTQCWAMSVNAGGVELDQCSSVLIRVDQCWSMLTNINQCCSERQNHWTIIQNCEKSIEMHKKNIKNPQQIVNNHLKIIRNH